MKNRSETAEMPPRNPASGGVWGVDLRRLRFAGGVTGFDDSAGERPRQQHVSTAEDCRAYVMFLLRSPEANPARNRGLHARVRCRTPARVGLADRNHRSQRSVLRSLRTVVAGGPGVPPRNPASGGVWGVDLRRLRFAGGVTGFDDSAGERPRQHHVSTAEDCRAYVLFLLRSPEANPARNRGLHARVRCRTPARVGLANRNHRSQRSVLRSLRTVVAGGPGVPPRNPASGGVWGVDLRRLRFAGGVTGFDDSAGERPRHIHVSTAEDCRAYVMFLVRSPEAERHCGHGIPDAVATTSPDDS